MTAIFNPFSEALRRPQITEMCDLVCSGCIGRYDQWARAIRDPFGWLGQWFQSTRRKVSGWLQRHKSVKFVIGHCWTQLMQPLFDTLALISWANPLIPTYIRGICLVQCLVLVPVFVCSDGCLQEPTKPSFLWKRWSPLLGSVAVRVSGRFNNSCYRINFHLRENQDSIWRCASFASEFGLRRLACHGACRRVLVHLKSLEMKGLRSPSNVLKVWSKGYLVCFRWLPPKGSKRCMDLLAWDAMLRVGEVMSFSLSLFCKLSRMTALQIAEALFWPQMADMFWGTCFFERLNVITVHWFQDSRPVPTFTR